MVAESGFLRMATKSRIMSPPKLQDDFNSWLHEIEVWKCVTDLDKKKQGPMLYLSLEGQTYLSMPDIPLPD